MAAERATKEDVAEESQKKEASLLSLYPTCQDSCRSNRIQRGASHLNDIFMFRPVYKDGERICILGLILHHTDLGGRVAGYVSGLRDVERRAAVPIHRAVVRPQLQQPLHHPRVVLARFSKNI